MRGSDVSNIDLPFCGVVVAAIGVPFFFFGAFFGIWLYWVMS